MPEIESSRLVLLARDRVMSRVIREDGVDVTEAPWEFSDTIPGVMLVGIWQIYQLMWIVLSKTETGHYQIFRSTNLQQFVLVHDHATEIYNLFWLDDGHMLFCATDGWWKTTDAGLTWNEFAFDIPPDPDTAVPEYASWVEMPIVYEDPDPAVEVPEYDSWADVPPLIGEIPCIIDPPTRSIASICLSENSWMLIAYRPDHALCYCAYPEGLWSDAYDPSSLWSGKWYPAIDGCGVGLLAGIGPYLLRSSPEDVTTWEQVQVVDGIVKSVQISNNSNKPTFLIVVDGVDAVDILYTTDDLGDTLTPMGSRAWPMETVESIVPTGGNSISTHFSVVGRRAVDSDLTYRHIAFDG